MGAGHSSTDVLRWCSSTLPLAPTGINTFGEESGGRRLRFLPVRAYFRGYEIYHHHLTFGEQKTSILAAVTSRAVRIGLSRPQGCEMAESSRKQEFDLEEILAIPAGRRFPA